MTKKKANSRVRINFLVDPELRKWAKAYARRRGMSLSQLCIRHLMETKDRAQGEDIEQI